MCGAELKALPEGVQRVASLLQAKKHAHAPFLLDNTEARTTQQTADLLGVALGQIAKSVVFRGLSKDVPVVVWMSGDQRVDEKKVEALLCSDGKLLWQATAAYVKSKTGFLIGGVPPLEHITSAVTLIDQSLFRFKDLWAAAGHPNAMFQLTPQDLERLTGAPVADFAVDAHEEKKALLNAINLVAARAIKIRYTGTMASPCISICSISEATGLCQGCFRSLHEIKAWGTADDVAKRDIWNAIEHRIAALQVEHSEQP